MNLIEDGVLLGIYLMGYDHCRDVKNDMRQCNNPYPPGSEEFIAWRRGWNGWFSV